MNGSGPRLKPDDFHISRRKMVETQLAARGIKDPRVLEAMRTVPRHLFVDEALSIQAYSDTPLPIGYGQTISQPYIVAFMTEALGLAPTDRVLEIGFGSGYQTAVLAGLVKEVLAVERLEAIYKKGRDNLQRLGLKNIRLKLDDGTVGWPEPAPYQAILVAAGGPKVPQPLLDQLAPSGRMVIPVGSSTDSQRLTLVVKEADGRITREVLSGCRFVSLVGQHAWS